ncbi:MAG TPA: Mov34/MPN/PAD-1 family protein [Candidatus Binatia bacterium]|nr:Mov34/MPN/PAD-1 family protein [Candidatus Binatia bacterium]
MSAKSINQRNITVDGMPTATTIHIPSNILEAIYAGAKKLYPRESFLLLRGKKSKGIISITDLILAPFAIHGEGQVHFNPYMFAGDYSLVGTVHSHPSGNISPSNTDLNYFFGRVLMIVGHPYEGKNCIAAYDSSGDKVPIEITAPLKSNDEEFY